VQSPRKMSSHSRRIRFLRDARAQRRLCDQGLFFPLREIFAPALRASLRPMATACLRLFTFPPTPPLPDFNVPSLWHSVRVNPVLGGLHHEYWLERRLSDAQVEFPRTSGIRRLRGGKFRIPGAASTLPALVSFTYALAGSVSCSRQMAGFSSGPSRAIRKHSARTGEGDGHKENTYRPELSCPDANRRGRPPLLPVSGVGRKTAGALGAG